MKFTLKLVVFFFIFAVSAKLNAQFSETDKFFKNFHPIRIFSVEVSSTIAIGSTQSIFLYFDNQYTLYQKPQEFISLKTGIGLGYMQSSFGKLATLGLPLQLIYAIGKNGHFFETSLGGRLNFGFSLGTNIQVIPFLIPTIGYRYQIPRKVYFNVYSAVQYHPNFGISPFLGLGVGYDY
jgi:hypothetical protein